jgi:hypothetical protein
MLNSYLALEVRKCSLYLVPIKVMYQLLIYTFHRGLASSSCLTLQPTDVCRLSRFSTWSQKLIKKGVSHLSMVECSRHFSHASILSRLGQVRNGTSLFPFIIVFILPCSSGLGSKNTSPASSNQCWAYENGGQSPVDFPRLC